MCAYVMSFVTPFVLRNVISIIKGDSNTLNDGKGHVMQS